MTVAVSGDSITFNDNSVQATAPKVGMVNRIINGAMVIDQRNAGASTAFSSSFGYTLDRWNQVKQDGSAGTIQQSTTAPTGFSNSLLVTNNATGISPASANANRIQTRIEGYNTADLGFGSALAQTVTVSFWVRSSVTGTYAIALNNSAFDRSYVSTYTINSANIWEQKFITVAGDQSGTWLTTNGVGLVVVFDLGSGSNFNTTANAWQSGNYLRTSGCINWIATSGATFYITGVQLEKGSTATNFDYRPYGTELQLCQRYYETMGIGCGGTSRGNTWCSATRYAVPKRATPTIAVLNTTLAFSNGSGTNTTLTGATLGGAAASSALGVCQDIYGTFSTAPSTGQSIVLLTDNAASVSAEL